MPKLEVKSNGKKTVVAIAQNRLTIGRQEGNDIVLEDKVASRRHCEIIHESGHFLIKDLKSANGTWMGENRIVEAELTFDDTIRIGSTFIRLVPDHVRPKKGKKAPVAKLIDEPASIDDEIPQGSMDGSVVSTTLAVRQLAAGPLSKQLAPLLAASVSMTPPKGAPDSTKDIRLINRRGKLLTAASGKTEKAADAIEALRQLLFVAFRTRATDLHVEPKPETYGLRFRIDGIMHSVGEITSKIGDALMNVIKVLCDIDISKRTVVQEGNFSVELASRRVDFRINMTPTMHGQKLALRFLDKGTVPDNFHGLGMAESAVAELDRICMQDSGMVILAGPTGSGKTTTLYTALKSINAEMRNIVTIEDPVEYELGGTTQISIDPRNGLTFSSVLSSVLRQDPDVILVGEIRDRETAKMAMQAATTGHLVFTTIHARDTVGTVFRLLDLGVEPFLIASAVTMCISQRLVRTLCENCKRPYKPDASQIRKMGLESRNYTDFYDPVGCKKCMNVGYAGRQALFEILMFNAQLRDVILTRPTITEIRKAAGEWMFETLSECGYRKIIDGMTSFAEVDRVASMA